MLVGGWQRRLRRGAGVALLVTALATGCGGGGVEGDAAGANAAATSGEGTAASGSTDGPARPRSEPVSDAVRNFEADTAYALGSGDVDVLGTPRMVALFETESGPMAIVMVAAMLVAK